MIAARTRLCEERRERRTKWRRGRRSRRVSGSKGITLRRIDSRETRTTLASLRGVSRSSVRSPPRIEKLTKGESKWTRVEKRRTITTITRPVSHIPLPLIFFVFFFFVSSSSFLLSDIRVIVTYEIYEIYSPSAKENAEEMEIGSIDRETQTERVHTIRAARSCPLRRRRIYRLFVGESRNKIESPFGWIHRKASDNLIYEKGKASGSPSYVPLTERFRWRYVGPRKAR